MRADVVARAMRLIRDGMVDREGVDGLARHLGYSVRQLNRVITAEVGTGPLAIARAQRGQAARILLETTGAARRPRGLRRRVLQRPPVQRDGATDLRRYASRVAGPREQGGAPEPHGGGDGCRDPRGAVAPPLPPPVQRRVGLGLPRQSRRPRVEERDGATYRRSMRLPHGYGVVALTATDHGDHGPAFVEADLHLSDLRDLTTAVSRCRQLLDLDADPVAILEALRSDPLIGPLVGAEPGRRVPGAVDGFELAVRAVIGQQVSVPGARTIAGRLVRLAGEAIPEPIGGITHLFPTPEALIALAGHDPAAFPMPGSRRRALVALAEAVGSGTVTIDPGTDPTELRATSGEAARDRTLDGGVRGDARPRATPMRSCRPTSGSGGRYGRSASPMIRLT